MNETIEDAALVLVFIVLGGLFNVAEISLISLREGQIRTLEARGTRRAARAAHLAADPNRFLAAVQVGVTCMGFLSAAFGADTLAGKVAPVFVRAGLSEGVADATALVGLTLAISYVSLVLGELTPKRIGLQRADAIAVLAAPVVDVMSVVLRPAIWLLGRSTDLMVRLLGGDPSAGRGSMSSEELRGLVAANTELGSDERTLIADVFAAGDRRLREVMVPRTEVTFLDAERPLAEVRAQADSSPHSRYPVVEGSYDAVTGFVHVRDLYGARGERAAKVRDLARPVKLLPGTKRVLEAMGEMRREGHHLAIVVDEYGGTAGIVTLEDLVEEVVGEIRDEYDTPEPAPTRRLAGGGVELDGLLNLADFAEETGVTLPEGPYETVAGCLVAALGRLPAEGDRVRIPAGPGVEVLLTVAKLEGRRIARVGVSAVTLAQPPGPEVS
ncbi:hemolysin family protein [Kitasatospora sp. NPDC057692]|uniref:hemolysin family protein n=1 Tax=Kitasatospora sp. NPDC057692 TaxID=3346215 RepID=UPI0036C31431